METRSLNLYLIKVAADRCDVVTDHGELVLSVPEANPNMIDVLARAESVTGAMVRLIADITTAVRITGVPLTRTTDDVDDPTLARLRRMILG